MNLFGKHPGTVHETYFQHFKNAFRYATALTFNGLACYVHAFLPFLFQTNASDCVLRLHDELQSRQKMSVRESKANP